MKASDAAMSVQDFQRCLASHGGDWQRWPKPWCDLAVACLRDHPLLATELQQARELDNWLDEWAVPEPSAALRTRILEHAATQLAFPLRPASMRERWRALWQELGGWPVFAPSLATGLLLGLLLVALDPWENFAPGEVDLLSAGQIDNAYEDLQL